LVIGELHGYHDRKLKEFGHSLPSLTTGPPRTLTLNVITDGR
jgi:hypothetical protein